MSDFEKVLLGVALFVIAIALFKYAARVNSRRDRLIAGIIEDFAEDEIDSGLFM